MPLTLKVEIFMGRLRRELTCRKNAQGTQGGGRRYRRCRGHTALRDWLCGSTPARFPSCERLEAPRPHPGLPPTRKVLRWCVMAGVFYVDAGDYSRRGVIQIY